MKLAILNAKKHSWISLKHKIVENKVVLLDNFTRVHPYQHGPHFEATHIIIEHCDESFVYYSLHPFVFPKVRHIYLNTHPVNTTILQRFNNKYIHPWITIPAMYANYRPANVNNILLATPSQFADIQLQMREEVLRIRNDDRILETLQ